MASVTKLPTAAELPVVQQRGRGRYPSKVVPGWKLQQLRNFGRLIKSEPCSSPNTSIETQLGALEVILLSATKALNNLRVNLEADR